MTFIATGKGLDRSKVENAVILSTEKYCGVHAALLPGIKNGITFGVEIKETENSDPEAD